jgi:hypothetical protein
LVFVLVVDTVEEGGAVGGGEGLGVLEEMSDVYRGDNGPIVEMARVEVETEEEEVVDDLGEHFSLAGLLVEDDGEVVEHKGLAVDTCSAVAEGGERVAIVDSASVEDVVVVVDDLPEVIEIFIVLMEEIEGEPVATKVQKCDRADGVVVDAIDSVVVSLAEVDGVAVFQEAATLDHVCPKGDEGVDREVAVGRGVVDSDDLLAVFIFETEKGEDRAVVQDAEVHRGVLEGDLVLESAVFVVDVDAVCRIAADVDIAELVDIESAGRGVFARAATFSVEGGDEVAVEVEVVDCRRSIKEVDVVVDDLDVVDAVEEAGVVSLEGDDVGVLEELGGLECDGGGVDVDMDSTETVVGGGGARRARGDGEEEGKKGKKDGDCT